MESLSWWKRIVSWLAPRAPVALSRETLLEAAQEGDAVLVKTLLVLGIEPDDVRTGHGETALWLAAERGHTDVVQVLLEAGADPCLQDVTGDTPLIRAAVNGHHGVIKQMASAWPDVFQTECAAVALRRAVLSRRARAVRALLEGGTPADARARGGHSAHFAAAAADAACLAELLHNGADPHQVDEEGRTALHHAAAANKPECITLLLVCGADRFAQDHAGHTPVDLAVTEKVRHMLLTAPHYASAPDKGCAGSSHSGELIPLQLLRLEFIPPSAAE